MAKLARMLSDHHNMSIDFIHIGLLYQSNLNTALIRPRCGKFEVYDR